MFLSVLIDLSGGIISVSLHFKTDVDMKGLFDLHKRWNDSSHIEMITLLIALYLNLPILIHSYIFLTFYCQN